MKTLFGFLLFCIAFLNAEPVSAQKINISGKVTGAAAIAIKEIQFICDGKMQSLALNKDDHAFSGDIKIHEPQFVEIKSGNPKAQYYYLVPGDKLVITFEKPSMQESIVTISNSKSRQLQDIFAVYYSALNEKNIDTRARDWQQLLFVNNEPLNYAETKLKEQMVKNASLIAGVPNFKQDLLLFLNSFRKYTIIDKMTLAEIEKALQEIKAARISQTALNIPFFKEYLTDLTNAYAARTQEKYGLNIDYTKQRNVSQFIAAEAITKFVDNHSIKSYLFSEKLKLEIPTNGLKNEQYVNYLYDNSDQFVKDFYQERIDKLKENKLPELNAPRKKAFNFLLQDSTGKEYRLSDFKGKMLFIDFWASWCAPCKAQIPHQQELEKKYAGKDIIFSSVSLDKSKPAWLKAVKDEGLHGIILHAEGDFKNEFPRAYGIESIPRYMLIDASGNIISDNMMKPQNKKEIMGIIDEELYAKNTSTILDKHFKAIGAEILMKTGLELETRQSVVSMNATNKTIYSYPDKLKLVTQFDTTAQMLMILGKDFFKETVTIMNGDKVSTNNPSYANIKNGWVNKIPGFELFLRKSIDNSVIKFAADNSTNNDSSYALKLAADGRTEYYYINKSTFLLDKITILTENVEPRKGGGFIEVSFMYEDYRNVNGVMIPFKVNQANIITIKVQHAEVKPPDESVFK